jgi:hypothetical protein
MDAQVIHQSEDISVYHNTDKHVFYVDIHTHEGATAILTEEEMVKLTCAIGTKLLELYEEIMSLQIGDHVKVKGNAPGTAWESGCIEHIEGDMAYIIYGVKTITEFGGIRGMGMPVPLSMLKRID